MPEMVYTVLTVLVLGALIVLVVLNVKLTARQSEALEQRHRAMLVDLHDGLAKQGDRLAAALADNSERLRNATSDELKQTRDTLHALRLALSENLGQSREAMSEKLAETAQVLTQKIDERLEQISGKVSERLDEGFKKTNETFTNVMTRLATIDEAQKKIETLTGSVVSLQELLGDKRSRGAFGEVQLEQIVRNQLPETAFEFQYTFSRGVRADCVLKLPEPMGLLAIDSKFPLENYERMFHDGADRISPAAFKVDVRKHIDDIADKYIIPGETSDGAVMFVPAEAVFAEIHARHRDLVEYAQRKRIWIASPTTLMAIVNTARVVIRDVETRKQIYIIKDELAKLAREFGRFDERLRKLADHVRQAHEDAQDVQISGRKLTQRFQAIERVELESPEQPQLRAVDLAKEK